MFRVALLALCLGAVCAQQVRYDNYTVYRLKPTTEGQLAALKALQYNSDGLSFWKEAHSLGDSVDIMVPPQQQSEFKDAILKFNIQSEVFIDNVQEKINDERSERQDNNVTLGRIGDKAFGWTDYYDLADLNGWLDSLVATYPQVTAIVGGQSYEGRQILGVKLSYKSGNPGVFIEAGIHAREWISPATVTWILNQLLTSTDAKVRAVAESFDWYIFPSTNPDGYAFTQTNDRLWRKTRKPSSASCVGTDPNRNWGYLWNTGGSSSNPCAETYAGSEAFSEPETKSLSQYLTSIADNIDVYLAFHSYSQFILLPYGTRDPPQNIDVLESIGRKAADVLEARHGTKYDVGTIYNLIGLASAASVDWVAGAMGVEYVFEFELRDKGRYGFLLPATQIVPTGEETLDAVVSILEDTLASIVSK